MNIILSNNNVEELNETCESAIVIMVKDNKVRFGSSGDFSINLLDALQKVVDKEFKNFIKDAKAKVEQIIVERQAKAKVVEMMTRKKDDKDKGDKE